MKKSMHIGILALLLVAAFLVVACGGEETTTTAAPVTTAAPTETTAAPTETTAGGPATGEPIKIGFLIDQTGHAAAPAKSVEQGVNLQVKYVNDNGGIDGRPIELITLDCKSDLPTAIANLNKLIKDDKVSAVLGPFSPFMQEPCGQIAEQTQTPLVNYGPSSLAQLTADPQNQWSFGLSITSVDQVAGFKQIIKDNGWKKLVGISDILDMNIDMLTVLERDSAAEGYEITALPDRVEFGTTDYQPILNKLMEAIDAEQPEAIMLLTVMLYTAPINKGLRALGVTQPILTTPSAGHPAIFTLGPDAVEGLMLIDAGGLANVAGLPDDWPLKTGQMEFAQRFQAEHEMLPNFFAAVGADSVSVMAEAMRQAGGDDKTKVQQALVNLTDFVGYTGIITFSPEMTAQGVDNELVQWVIKGGQFEFVRSFLK